MGRVQWLLPQYQEDWFLARAVLRYRRFLHMRVLYPGVHLVAPLDVELIISAHKVELDKLLLGPLLPLPSPQDRVISIRPSVCLHQMTHPLNCCTSHSHTGICCSLCLGVLLRRRAT